jgi:hypothetical protein
MENLKQGQSILDFTVQHTGSVEGLFDLLNLNGLKNLANPTELLKIPSSVRPKVVAHFKQNRIVPAAKRKRDQSGGAFSNAFSNAFN